MAAGGESKSAEPGQRTGPSKHRDLLDFLGGRAGLGFPLEIIKPEQRLAAISKGRSNKSKFILRQPGVGIKGARFAPGLLHKRQEAWISS